MVKVKAHGKKFTVDNPTAVGGSTRMMNIVFVEEGREDLGTGISRSNAVLSRALGKDVGIRNVRTHTQPIPEEDWDRFPIDSEHPNLFINRSMYSTPQVETQRTVVARMYDGNITYFLTELGATQEPDQDKRMSLETMAHLQPLQLLNARIRTANVRDVEQPVGPIPAGVQGQPTEGVQGVEHQNLAQQ